MTRMRAVSVVLLALGIGLLLVVGEWGFWETMGVGLMIASGMARLEEGRP